MCKTLSDAHTQNKTVGAAAVIRAILKRDKEKREIFCLKEM